MWLIIKNIKKELYVILAEGFVCWVVIISKNKFIHPTLYRHVYRNTNKQMELFCFKSLT